MKKITIFFCLLMVFSITKAQNISGVVHNEAEHTPLPGANIFWLGTQIGTSSNANGEFSIKTLEKLPHKLVISFVGFKTDTILIQNKTQKLDIHLKPLALNEIEITGKENRISTIKTINVEKINAAELRKAACCNLSESFENSATVNVVFSDAVSGAKQIQMLGLQGIYTQMLSENIPTLRGISSTYGLNLVPGPWMESIQVVKGAGSVMNGYESTTGQINMEFLKPDEADKFYLDLFGSQAGRLELNTHFAHKFSKKWSSILMVNAGNMSFKQDQNQDNFLDVPLYQSLNILNRWKYFGAKFRSQFGLKITIDERIGGQKDFDKNKSQAEQNAYGINIKTQRLEAFAKTGFILKKEFNSLGIVYSAIDHQQKSFFGLRTYDARQKSFYTNLIYQTILGTDDHQLKFGASYLYDDYDETYLDSTFKRTESVPGAYGEYSFTTKKIKLVTGFRADYHNLFDWILTPRFHFKYNPNETTALRLSAGRGFRVANVFAENLGTLASSRTVIVVEKLNPEEAWNFGANFTKSFDIGGKEASLAIDYYETHFENQVVVDLENPSEIRFYNLNGKSYSKSFQVEGSYEPIKKLDIRLAYKMDDVRTTFDDNQKLRKPYVAQQRALFNVSYATNYDKWKFNFTAQWVGEQRIPKSHLEPGIDSKHRNLSQSPDYFLFNAQITKRHKNLEVSLGSENLFNFTQENPIVFANNPFGNNFDASMTWAPVLGRRVYLALKWKIE